MAQARRSRGALTLRPKKRASGSQNSASGLTPSAPSPRTSLRKSFRRNARVPRSSAIFGASSFPRGAVVRSQISRRMTCVPSWRPLRIAERPTKRTICLDMRSGFFLGPSISTSMASRCLRPIAWSQKPSLVRSTTASGPSATMRYSRSGERPRAHRIHTATTPAGRCYRPCGGHRNRDELENTEGCPLRYRRPLDLDLSQCCSRSAAR